MSQRLRKEGNARINKVSAMRRGLAKIIEKVSISWYFESPKTGLHIEENASCIDYADALSSKRVYRLSNSQSPHCGTSDSGYGDTLELYTRVTRAGLPITGIHMWVASKFKIHWILATVHNSRWMHNCKVCHGSIEAIFILDPVDVEEAYSNIALRYHSAQWQAQSHGWHDVSVGYEENLMETRLVFRGGVSSTEAVQIPCWIDSNDGPASHYCKYPRSFPEVVIVWNVGLGNGYQSWGGDILYDPIPRGLSEVYGESILHQTLTRGCQQSPNLTEQQSHLLCNCFRILSIILLSVWFVQRWWRISNA
jgi:hypothetical protein